MLRNERSKNAKFKLLYEIHDDFRQGKYIILYKFVKQFELTTQNMF